MRQWRKIYKGIGESDKMARLSFDARWLFILFLVKQDDAGIYPWSRSKMKSLVAGSTEWTTEDVQRLSTELVTNKLIEVNDDHIVIIDGKNKNGNLYKWLRPLLYDIPSLQHDSNVLATHLKQVATINDIDIDNDIEKENINGQAGISKMDTKSRFNDISND